MTSPKKSSARISLIFQRASASTTTATKMVEATRARRAVCLISARSCRPQPQRNHAPSGRLCQGLDERVFGHYNWPHGARRAGRSRCPRAQPEGRHRPAAAPCPDLHHGPVRLGEVEPRLRHDLRRGPATLRREPVRVRAPVPADDGEARRRLDRRPLPGDLDRPEDDLAQPALDRRHRHRDLRLPAPPVRARRAAALPGLRTSDRRSEPGADRRPGAAPARRDALHGQRAGRARPQGRVQGRARGAAPRRIHAREGRRRAAPARGPDRARQEVQAHDRGRRRPAAHEAGPAYAPRAVDRDGGRARRRAGRDRRRGRRADDVQRELRLSRARRLAPGAPAAHLLLQLPARRLPALHRPGRAAGDRPGPARPRSVALGRRGRARPVVGRQLELLRVRDPGDRRPLRDRPRLPLVRAARGPAEAVPVRDEGRARVRAVPQPDGPEALLHALVRGHRPQPRAALQGDRLVTAARADRGVHELPPVPGLQRRPAQARGAGRDGRRRGTSTSSRRCPCRARSSSSTRSS